MIVLLLLFLIVIFWLLWLHCDFVEFKKNLIKNYELLEKRINKIEGYEIKEENQEIILDNDIDNQDIEKEKSVVKEIERKEKTKKSFENIFFGSVFNKIGALALVIAVAIFVMFVSQFLVFTPIMRVSVGFIIGLVSVIFSLNIHNKNNMNSYSEVLMGIGLASLFISTYCATTLFHIFPTYLGIGIGLILLLATYVLAETYKSYSALGLGLLGGYINPFFLFNDLSLNYLFGYLLFLNAISLIYVYKNQDKRWINFINLFLTTVFLAGESVFSAEKFNIICPIILWGMYLSFDLLSILSKKSENEKEHYMSSYMNLGVLSFLSWLVFSDYRMILGGILFSYALVYLVLVCYFLSKAQKKILRPYFYALIAVVYMGTFFISTGITRVILWTLETLIVTVLRYKLNLKYLTKWVLFLALTSVVSLLRINSSIVQIDSYVPILNLRLVLFGLPVVVMILCSKILSKCPKSRDSQVSLFLTFLYSTLIYLYVIFEFNSWIIHSAFVSNSVDNMFITLKAMVNIIIGFIYAMHLKFLADIKESYIFRLLSYMMWGVSSVFLILLGVRYMPVEGFLPILNLRFFAFVVAIVSALVYSKLEKKYWFDYLAIGLGFLLISYETADYLIKFGLYDSSGFVITIMWILYLAILSLFGLAFDVKSLKCSAICISILTVFKIIFYDIAGLDEVYKVVVFLLLGLVLMLISYFYNKFQGEDNNSDVE